MRTILREDESGVSEVIGTILILAMTVVLFSVIIIWVSSIPTPAAQTRLDVRPEMVPIYNGLGVEIGVNITLVHLGGEALQPVPTIIYVVSQRGSSTPQTDVVILHLYNGLLATPSGLLDGRDSVWDIGERWGYKNFLLRSSDSVSITIVDIQKSIIVWTGQLNAPAGTRPPVFVDKWTDGFPSTDIIDPVQATLGFNLYAKVADPDNDLNPNSVYAILTMWYGVNPTCSMPLKMRDDGVAPDLAAGDHIFTLGSSCMSSPLPPLDWDGSIILLNATDRGRHVTTTRFELHVVPQTFGGGGPGGRIPSELWQYIGFIQVRAEEAWFTHMGDTVGTANRFPLGRVQRNDLNTGGGALFHLLMANHGNRTVFVDGFTAMSFRSASASSVQTIYIVCGVQKDLAGNVKCPTVNPTNPANAGGLAKYPGTGVFTNFEYAQVFDINPLNQEIGGAPVQILAVTRTQFTCCTTTTWGADSFFPSILVSGISGPVNMTYQQIITQWGASYNPYDHLNDANPAWKTQWYAQVIPFIAMTVI